MKQTEIVVIARTTVFCHAQEYSFHNKSENFLRWSVSIKLDFLYGTNEKMADDYIDGMWH
jgi:hypothetical protein